MWSLMPFQNYGNFDKLCQLINTNVNVIHVQKLSVRFKVFSEVSLLRLSCYVSDNAYFAMNPCDCI
jgi:hypothetical protein